VPGGTYTLIVESPATTVEVGALGECTFEPGWYAYVGSAFGPGGLGRVDRHREVATGERDTRHWHVDYLLGHPDTSIETTVTTEGEEIECAVAESLGGGRVSEFGASDCDCAAHLIHGDDLDALVAAVERAHGAAKL